MQGTVMYGLPKVMENYELVAIANACRHFRNTQLTIECNGVSFNPVSVINAIPITIMGNAKLVITAEGPNETVEKAAIDALAKCITKDLPKLVAQMRKNQLMVDDGDDD